MSSAEPFQDYLIQAALCRSEILEVQQQPQLERGMREGYIDILPSCPRAHLVNIRPPIVIEQSPDLDTWLSDCTCSLVYYPGWRQATSLGRPSNKES
jgi:hypothetical protein